MSKNSPSVKGSDIQKKIIERYKELNSASQCAIEFKYSKTTILNVLHMNGVIVPSKRTSPLSCYRIKQITRLYREGDDLTTIAKKVKLTENQIQEVLIEKGLLQKKINFSQNINTETAFRDTVIKKDPKEEKERTRGILNSLPEDQLIKVYNAARVYSGTKGLMRFGTDYLSPEYVLEIIDSVLGSKQRRK